MSLGHILKHAVPGSARRLGWRLVYRARDRRLTTIVGCHTSRRVVALTFDDGPNADSTPLILEILAHYQIHATFFMLGRNVAAYPETAREAAKAGHAIGNHTFTHPCLADCNPAQVARELFQCQRIIRQVTGIVPEVMRPPYGAQASASYLIARIMGYSIVNWTASGDDWQGDPASVVAQRVLKAVQPGSVVLLHDSLEPPPHQTQWLPADLTLRDRSPTIEALPMIIEPLKRQGYQFITLPEMIRVGSLIRQSWFY